MLKIQFPTQPEKLLKPKWRGKTKKQLRRAFNLIRLSEDRLVAVKYPEDKPFKGLRILPLSEIHHSATYNGIVVGRDSKRKDKIYATFISDQPEVPSKK